MEYLLLGLGIVAIVSTFAVISRYGIIQGLIVGVLMVAAYSALSSVTL